MPSPTHIAELALYVDNLDHSTRFNTGLFGGEVLLRDHRFSALRVSAGQVLLLFQRGGSAQPLPTPGGTIPSHDGRGQVHACFGIAADAVSLWTQHLKALQLPVEAHVQWPSGAISLYFRDPDRHSIELATPGVWSRSSSHRPQSLG